MSLLGELKRRRVFQVAAVYAVMAWLIIQVIDVINDPLNLPGWLDTVVIVLLAVGFPIAIILAWAFDLTPHGIEREAGARPADIASGLSGQSLMLAIQTLVLLAVGFLVIDHFLSSPKEQSSSDTERVRRFALDLPWQEMTNWGDFRVRISPRGTHLVYPGSDENRTTINLRPLDSLDSITLVSPSADPWNLAFSPDGERLAFVQNTWLLAVVSIRGGRPETIIKLPDELVSDGFFEDGISWADDDNILVGVRGGVMKVSVSGGESVFTSLGDDAAVYSSPYMLPDGRNALVSISRRGEAQRLGVVDLEKGTARSLPFQSREAIYSPTGHVLFRQGAELMAARFDLDALAIVGQPQEIARNVASGPRLSEDGTLVYVAERVDGTAGLVWVDRQGLETPLNAERRDYTHVDLSPDGKHLLVDTYTDINAFDISRGTFIPISSDRDGASGFPVWHPNSRLATFWQGDIIYEKTADTGLQRNELLAAPVIPTSWSPDGDRLAVFDNRSDIWILNRDGGYEPFLNGPNNERSGRFSPDGSAFAYVSDESGGEFQVYVTPYPGPGRRVPVSIDGGLSPIWSTDGKELYFRQGSKVMAARIVLGSEIDVATPVELFDGPYTVDLSGHQRYDVAPDGRFLMVENSEDFRVVVVEGFFNELRRLVPAE
jgi:Tol biopolymer transport system component